MNKKIKNVMKTIITVSTAVVMMAIPVFAETAKTIEVKGYIWEGITEDELSTINSNFAVSNVIKTYDVENIDGTCNDGLIVNGSTTVELLDDCAMFEVYKLTNKEDLSCGELLPVKGKLKIYDYNDETGESKELTIDYSELVNYEVDFPTYLKGCSVTISEPGDYYVIFRYPAIAGAAEAIITVNSDSNLQESNKTEQEKNVKAKSTSSKVLVNNEEISFDAYNIANNNYFKLRDLAKVVSGSNKQFNVTWDGEKRVINLISNQQYTVVGGELVVGDGLEKDAKINTAKIYKDGKEIELKAYTINNNNYFKLRDVAKVFDFGVNWNGETKTISINTSSSYVED